MNDDEIQAIILVGGKGTRLHSVVGDRPKPMAEVAGRPFVEWLLLALRAQGARRIVLATGYKGDMVEAYFKDGAALGLELRYARERVPLGTGGATRHALEETTTPDVLVLNGDSFCPFDVGQLVEARRRTAAEAVLWLVETEDSRRFGSVDVEENGRIVAFHEKSPALGAGRINAGIYLFDRRALEALPDDQAMSLERDVFPVLIQRARGLYSVTGSGPFLDIGTPEAYRSADQFLAENRALWRDVP